MKNLKRVKKCVEILCNNKKTWNIKKSKNHIEILCNSRKIVENLKLKTMLKLFIIKHCWNFIKVQTMVKFSVMLEKNVEKLGKSEKPSWYSVIL